MTRSGPIRWPVRELYHLLLRHGRCCIICDWASPPQVDLRQLWAMTTTWSQFGVMTPGPCSSAWNVLESWTRYWRVSTKPLSLHLSSPFLVTPQLQRFPSKSVELAAHDDPSSGVFGLNVREFPPFLPESYGPNF